MNKVDKVQQAREIEQESGTPMRQFLLLLKDGAHTWAKNISSYFYFVGVKMTEML